MDANFRPLKTLSITVIVAMSISIEMTHKSIYYKRKSCSCNAPEVRETNRGEWDGPFKFIETCVYGFNYWL